MLIFLYVWIIVTALTALVWASRHVQISIAARTMPPLDSRCYPVDVGPLPAISFLVAGKDEEENIEACLRSMCGQDYPNVKELLPGWLGKNNAMRTAIERARGEWLCFTDADCTQVSRRTLRIAMNYALEHRLDFLSILPAHDTQSFWEAVVQPACSGILLIWFNPLVVNNPKSKAAYANGAFMLMRRDCYEAIGRHEAVKAEFNEDMHMARIAKAMGKRLRVISNDDLYTVRMYGSLKATWAGWSRIFYGCFGTLRRLVHAMIAVSFVSIFPWVTLLISGIAVASGTDFAAAWKYLLYAAAVCCLAQETVMLRFYALNHTPALYGLLYPVGASVGLGALINAIRRLRHRATITWRGTTYNANINVAPSSPAR
jgi:cellulose synthase/poly-beta-1,6-N-acetylglucosamine synthase-like glycosyltransferase